MLGSLLLLSGERGRGEVFGKEKEDEGCIGARFLTKLARYGWERGDLFRQREEHLAFRIGYLFLHVGICLMSGCSEAVHGKREMGNAKED